MILIIPGARDFEMHGIIIIIIISFSFSFLGGGGGMGLDIQVPRVDRLISN